MADNGAAGKYQTHVAFDIQGHQLSTTDPLRAHRRHRTIYDMQGARITQSSMEAGQRWMLNDVLGKPIRTWDSRGHNCRTTYDALRRPTGLFVLGTDAANSDPRTLAARSLYRDDRLRRRPAQRPVAQPAHPHLPAPATPPAPSPARDLNPVTNQQEAYDFKGNLLRSTRQFVADPKALTDWSRRRAAHVRLLHRAPQPTTR